MLPVQLRPIRSGTTLSTLLATLLAWGCAPDQSPTEPTARPDLGATTAATFRIRNLGTLGGSHSDAYDINDAGVIVGWADLSGNLQRHAFSWKSGIMTDLGTLAGGRESHATAINQDGVIVGWSRVSSGDKRAVRWMNGLKRNLGTLGGRNSEATAINVFGHIVGWSETASGARHAFLWKNGVMTDIGTMGGAHSIATGINRSGAIVGQSTTASGENHAFRWKDGVFKRLAPPERALSFATAINTAGQIVGWLGHRPDAQGEELDESTPFVFQRDVLTILPRRRFVTEPQDISPTGLIVGIAESEVFESSSDDPLLWENGTLQVLPELTDGHSGARAINRSGNIVGYGQTTAGNIRAVMWRRQ